MSNEIETIAEGTGWHQFRRKIPGGWVYESTIEYPGNLSACCCFIPDPDHEWKLEGDGSKDKKREYFCESGKNCPNVLTYVRHIENPLCDDCLDDSWRRRQQ